MEQGSQMAWSGQSNPLNDPDQLLKSGTRHGPH